MASAGTIAPSAGATYNLFAADLIKTVSLSRPTENVIYSPASIHACLGLAFFGAEGATAEEIRGGLHLGKVDKSTIASNYGEFLKSTFKNSNNNNVVEPEKGDPILKMANRIYVNQKLGGVNAEFNKIAVQNFDSKAESVNFEDSQGTVEKINSWVENQTNNKIKDLLQPSAVNGDTSAVLVNAIYFKALWKNPFSSGFTHKSDFAMDAEHKVKVDMMEMDDERVKYVELADLDATAIELPYKNSDLSMMIILPNQVEGLKDLEQKLMSIDLNVVSSKMQMQSVDVYLPKFKIEFEVDLKKPLMQLGMTTMFGDNANFSKLFDSETPQKVSEVRHKAYLEVNEAGSEAAAASFMKIVPMSLNLDTKRFMANHPFVFAIRNSKAVFFAGHVSKF